MRVDIPKPCNENWGEMNPTERGAFCQSCAVDVIDFSKKNAEEVRETLRLNIGKQMCGRFKKSQLSALSESYQTWENQSINTFQSKFLWACMIAFGLTLFTGCENSNAQDLFSQNYSISHTTNLPEDSLKMTLDSTVVDSIDHQHTADPADYLIGDINIEPEPELLLMGEPSIEFWDVEEIDTSSCETNMKDSIPPRAINPAPIEYVKGKFEAPPRFMDYLADTVKVEHIQPSIQTETIQAMAFPNPSSGQTTLQVATTEVGYYTIDLYNLSGKKMQTIYSGKINEGIENFTVNLANYPSGTYLIKITSNNVAHALKVNKVN